MAKFSLLTSLTLQAAGFDKGISSAKKSAKALSDGVKEAGSSMSSALSSLNGGLGDLTNQFDDLTQVALGGVSAFKKMIPAINGVKTALIASGIGIVVLAFGSLMKYLKGTEEGANKLAIAVGYLKGAFAAIDERIKQFGKTISLVLEGNFKEAFNRMFDGLFQRIKLIGEGIVLLFNRDLQGALKKFNEASHLKIFDEIKEKAKEGADIAKKETQWNYDRIQLMVDESEMISKINELKSIAWNQDKSMSPEKRQKALNEARSLEYSLMKRKVKLAEDELSIEKAKNAQSTSGWQEKEREAEIQVKINQATSEYYSRQKEYLEKQLQINNALKAAQETIKFTNAEVQNTSNIILSSVLPAVNKVKTAISYIQTEISSSQAWDLYKDGLIGIFGLVKTQGVNAFQEITKEGMNLGGVIAGTILDSVTSLSSAFGSFFDDTAEGFKSVVTSVLEGIRQIINALLAEAIAGMIANGAKKGLVGLFAASAGIAALTALWKSKVPEFHTGGIVGGVGEIPALLQPKEMVLTTGQQKNLFDMINGGSTGGGEVTFRIEDNVLVGVLERYNRRTKGYR